MAFHGPKVISALQKKHLVHLGNHVLDIQPPLVIDSTKAELIAAITAHMEVEQDCPNSKCLGQCRPEVHEWTEAQYTPAGDGDVNSIMAAINGILTNAQHDNPLGSSTSSFLTPGNASAVLDGPGDPQQQRLRLVQQTCAVLGVDFQQAAAQLTGGQGQQQQVRVEHQPPAQPQPGSSLPVLTPPQGQQLQVGVQQQAPVQPQPGYGQPQSVPTPPQDGSSAPWLAILQQQQVMMDRQTAQQDRLLKLLEAAQNKSSHPESNQDPSPPASSGLSAGRVGVIAPRNAENLALAGVSLPPMLRIEGDLATIDMAKMKTKLRSGRHWAGEAVASVMEPWPQQYLDRLLTTPVPHNKLTLPQYFCGSITKIFSELDPSLRGSRVENQVKLLMLLSKQSLLSPWEDILALSDSLYCSLEQSSVSWDSWPSIQTWWDRSVDSLRSRSLQNPNKRFKHDDGKDGSTSSNSSGVGKAGQEPSLVVGLPAEWYKTNNICIKYNLGACEKPSSHKTVHGDHTLKHICGGCLKLEKGEDSSHPAKNCQHKSQFFA